MKTVLILARGRRLSGIFGRLAKELSRKNRVVVIFFDTYGYTDNPDDWSDVEGLVAYSLGDEMAKCARGDLQVAANKIHKIIGLSAYTAASNYLLYQRFAREYFGAWPTFYSSEEEILREFIASYHLLEKIFDEHAPHLVFCETPDLIAHRVAQAVSFHHGIFTIGFGFNTVFGDGFVNFKFGCNYRNPVLEYYLTKPEEISEESWNKADRLLKNLESGLIRDAAYIQNYKKQIQKRGLSLRKFRDLAIRSRKITTAAEFGEIARRQVVGVWNRLWLNRHLSRELPKGRYVLVSLHYQPEATTCLAAPRWVDQDKIIEQLAINAPADVRIAVKENPRKFGLRGRSYYEPLKNLPNVDLIHPLVSNDALIRGAAAILSITGTVGLEGIALGKRVAVLGSPSYELYNGVRKIFYPEEIFAHLADEEWRPETLLDQRREFLGALAESCFFLGPSNKGDPWPLPKHAGPSLAQAIEKFMALIERSDFRPSDILAVL